MKRCYFLLFLTLLRLFFYSPTIFNPEVDFESTNFVFKIVSEPTYSWHRQELEVEVLGGDYNILVYIETWPKYDLFDQLEVSCNLSEIKNNSDFDYKKYLNDQGIFALCFYPNVYSIKKYDGRSIKFFFWKLKKSIYSKIDKNLPEPANGLMKAMVLGSKSQLLPELRERLGRQGLAHVLTISGLHLGLLIYFFRWFLKKLNFKKKPINLFSTIFIVFYLFLISFPISALRSALMLIFVFYSKKGVKHRFFTIFCLMLIFSPSLLRNISFQLSFLAVFAIIFFLPILNIYLAKVFKIVGKEKLFYKSKIVSLLSLSLAINVVIWPLVVFYFSYYNYLSFVYNILLVPLIPFFLIFSFLAIIFPFLEIIFFYVLYMLGNYINLVSFLDFAYFELSLGVSFLLVYYLIIFVIVLRHSVFVKKRKVIRFIEKANWVNKKTN